MNLTVTLSNNDVYAGEVFFGERFYRKPHDIEIRDYDTDQWEYMGDGYRLGKVRDTVIGDPVKNPSQNPMPEVYRVFPEHPIPLNCEWQWFWRNLNPELTDFSFSTLMDDSLAWMNHTGTPGRKNCILQEDMNSDKYPAFDTPRLCGGAILKRAKVTNNGLFYMEGLLTGNPVPDPEDVLNNKPYLWYYGTGVRKDGGINYIRRMGKDGTRKKVRIPILSRYPLYIKESFLDELPPGIQYKDPVTFG